jgi:3-oxoadipate enol-lactonase
MSFAIAADGTRLHYEFVGRPGADPVVCIQGLGADLNGWFMQRLAFAPRYRTLALDNRGAGRSDKPQGPYSLPQMADDVVAVMDHAGVERAHVMGASMGGAIAQMMAVRHPERVRSLVLACTACRHQPWRRDLLTEWADLALRTGMGEVARQGMRWMVGPRSFRRFWPALGLFGPFVLGAPAHAFAAQVGALLSFDDDMSTDLGGITMPTAIVVGSQDILTPLADSEELAELIPGSQLTVISGAAHGLMIEHALAFNRVVLDFLGRVDRAERLSAAA